MKPNWLDLIPLDHIDPTATDDEAAPVPQVVGCVFGSRSDEMPEIPMENAIAVLHRISEWINRIEAAG